MREEFRFCGNCRFFTGPPAEGAGQCRRDPPRARPLEVFQEQHPDLGAYWRIHQAQSWPALRSGEWCGRHKLRRSMAGNEVAKFPSEVR
jgi:hypothetical protein